MEQDKIIKEYIDKSTWRLNENANFGFSLSGLKSHVANTILAREQLENTPAGELHKLNSIYIHDLSGSSFGSYCYGSDLQSLLMNGVVNPTGGSSEAAKHLDVAVDHIVNYFYVSQNEWEGAQSFSNFDTLLSPFIYYDELNYKQVKQCMQRMVYNLSYPLRASFQSPFTNLSFDLKCPDHMKNEPAIIGGDPQEKTLSEFQNEMDMINLAYIEVMMEGDRDGRPFTFPISTYSITEDFDWDSEVVKRLFELTAKFGTPYFMSFLGSGLKPASQRAMCCRLQLSLEDIIDQSKGGLWNTGISTGSIGVVTINMGQLGYLTYKEGGSLDIFYHKLDNLMEAAYIKEKR
jgi:ribonucleoside-triphosphate reductase